MITVLSCILLILEKKAYITVIHRYQKDVSYVAPHILIFWKENFFNATPIPIFSSSSFRNIFARCPVQISAGL
jgi:hypothetical protein